MAAFYVAGAQAVYEGLQWGCAAAYGKDEESNSFHLNLIPSVSAVAESVVAVVGHVGLDMSGDSCLQDGTSLARDQQSRCPGHRSRCITTPLAHPKGG